jgi:hypothetical protein
MEVLNDPLDHPLGDVLPIKRDIAQGRHSSQQFLSEENDAVLGDVYDPTSIPVVSQSVAVPLDGPRIARVGLSLFSVDTVVGRQCSKRPSRVTITKLLVLDGISLVASS